MSKRRTTMVRKKRRKKELQPERPRARHLVWRLRGSLTAQGHKWTKNKQTIILIKMYRRCPVSGPTIQTLLLTGFLVKTRSSCLVAEDLHSGAPSRHHHCHVLLNESRGRFSTKATTVVSCLFLLLLRNKPSKPSTRASRQNGKEETATGTRWVCLIELKEESDQKLTARPPLCEREHFTERFPGISKCLWGINSKNRK